MHMLCRQPRTLVELSDGTRQLIARKFGLRCRTNAVLASCGTVGVRFGSMGVKYAGQIARGRGGVLVRCLPSLRAHTGDPPRVFSFFVDGNHVLWRTPSSNSHSQ